MAFQKAEVVQNADGSKQFHHERDKDGRVIGVTVLFRLYDDARQETLDFPCTVTGPEFDALPPKGQGRRPALQAIFKRMIQEEYAIWQEQIANRPKPPVVADVDADLGLDRFEDLSGAAPAFEAVTVDKTERATKPN